MFRELKTTVCSHHGKLMVLELPLTKENSLLSAKPGMAHKMFTSCFKCKWMMLDFQASGIVFEVEVLSRICCVCNDNLFSR
jgi:hypothetical protein